MFDPTLNGVIAQIESGKIVLPAMQRPFVWKDDRLLVSSTACCGAFRLARRCYGRPR